MVTTTWLNMTQIYFLLWINYCQCLIFSPQLPNVALMVHYVYLVDLWRVLVGWRSASMECGEQCVMTCGITMMPKLCAGSWGTVLTQVELSMHYICIHQRCRMAVPTSFPSAQALLDAQGCIRNLVKQHAYTTHCLDSIDRSGWEAMTMASNRF